MTRTEAAQLELSTIVARQKSWAPELREAVKDQIAQRNKAGIAILATKVATGLPNRGIKADASLARQLYLLGFHL